jgi:hypothetical protein
VTWINGGDPVAGINPTYTGLTGELYPMASFYNNGAMTLQLTSADFNYPIPTGFAPWLGTESTEWINTVFSLNFQGANGSKVFTDDAGATWTANGTAAISTTEPFYGVSSGYFDGASWISTPSDPRLAAGTQNFAYQMRIKSAGNATYDQLCGQRSPQGDGRASWSLTRAGSTANLYLSFSDGTNFTSVAGTRTVFDNVMHEVEISRIGNQFVLRVDGVTDVSITLPDNYSFYELASTFSIGRAGDYDGQYFKGYIGGFRLIVGDVFNTADYTPTRTLYPTH